MAKKMYRYYSVLRPVSIGTIPTVHKLTFRNFMQRQYVESIGREAWGYVEYDSPLTEEEASQYDLIPEKESPS